MGNISTLLGITEAEIYLLGAVIFGGIGFIAILCIKVFTDDFDREDTEFVNSLEGQFPVAITLGPLTIGFLWPICMIILGVAVCAGVVIGAGRMFEYLINGIKR